MMLVSLKRGGRGSILIRIGKGWSSMVLYNTYFCQCEIVSLMFVH